jgi:L-seryl-tRNA(Ser) seleniumtransferase
MTQPMTSMTRRRFLQGVGVAPIAGVLSVDGSAQTAASAGVYERLGVRPLINAAGTYTALSASLLPREVAAAMDEASRQFVSIPELQAAAGRRIASLLGAEAALVTSGCAAALTLATAACVAGADPDAIRRLPDTSGMKNEVVVQKAHRFGYDRAIRNVGVTLVEVQTREQLQAAIGERTALLFFLNNANDLGEIAREEFAGIAKTAGVPSLVDAAADVPPVGNLRAFTDMGYDLAAFSGGKGLRGPQCSGLLMGRRDLVDAAFLNGSPHSDTIGRIAKVGKEEIVGLTRALELYLERDHQAEWDDWEFQVREIAAALESIPTVRTERFVPAIANETPHLAITWDPRSLRLSRADVIRELRDGDPRIEVRPGPATEPRLEIGVWMMQPGEHRVVAKRCSDIFKDASA